MPNEDKKPSASNSRFPSRKRRRSFAPPKGITPTAKETVVIPPVKEEKPSPQKASGEPQTEKNQKPAHNAHKKNKKPFYKNRPRKDREHSAPRAVGEKPVEKEELPAEEEIFVAPAKEESSAKEGFSCPHSCEDCSACGEAASAPEEEQPKVTIVGVRFKESGKIYYFAPGDLNVKKGESVIVETSRGIECGKVAVPNRQINESSLTSPLKKLVRTASEQDLRKVEQLRKQEEQAKEIWEKKLKNHKLEMTLVDVEYTFDSQKLIFYFTAEGRVDFRDFVKDLATVFKTRIELRQIGVRDEAKQIGGLGVCGRPFCCKTFLDDFQQVSIKMAKEQNLSLNSVKISGTCGRLMCCLRYENEVYEQESKKTPKVDTAVMTPDGRGVVTENNVLKGTCRVRLDKKPDLAPTEYHRDQLQILGKAPRHNPAKNEEESPAEEKND